MASRVNTNDYKNFPVKAVRLYEGAVTRADVVGPDGGIIEDALSRAAPLEKGDYVIMYASSTDKERMVVTKFAAGNELNILMGVIVSDPKGQDAVTVSGQAAAVDQMRIADVAFFGSGIIEVEVNGETKPGDSMGLSESEYGVFGPLASPGASASPIALKYGIDGEVVPILVGNAVFMPAD